MGRNTSIIPVAPIARLIKERFSLRVSKKATELLSQHLEERGEDIAQKAHELSQHAGRTTILDRDVQLAKKK